MDNRLLDYHLVDLKGLLLLQYKSLGISEDELVVLLVLILLQDTHKNINSSDIEKYTNYSLQQIDTILMKLIQKKLIQVVGANIQIDGLISRLTYLPAKEEKKVDLLLAFEQEFAHSLSPMEQEALKAWKNQGYSDEMILDALREASMRNVHSMRYIETILLDWAKNGVKRSGKEKIKPKDDDEEYIDYHWWENE